MAGLRWWRWVVAAVALVGASGVVRSGCGEAESSRVGSASPGPAAFVAKAEPLRARASALPTPALCELLIVDVFGGEVAATVLVAGGAQEDAPNGRWDYEIQSAPGGAPLVTVSAPDYIPVEVDLLCPGRRTVVLMPASRIRGRVTLNGAPALGLPVRVRSGDHEASIEGEADFVFGRLPPGSYLIEATAPGLRGVSERVIHLGLAEEVNGIGVDLQAAGSLRGRVRAGRAPLGAGVRARVGGREGITGEDSSFVVDGIVPGQHVLQLVGPPTSSMLLYVERPVTVANGETEIDVDVGERSVLAVLAVDGANLPLVQVSLDVEWSSDDGRIIRRPCITDDEGRCSLEGLEPGRIVARLDVGGGAGVIEERSIPSPQALILRAGGELGRLIGSLRDANGAAANGRMVVLRRVGLDTAPPPAVAFSDDSGAVTFAPVERGRYRLEVLRARDPADVETALEVDVEAVEQRLSVVLDPPLDRVWGQVTDEVGAAAPGARVRVLPAMVEGVCWVRFPQGGEVTVADLRGRFELAGVPLGGVVVATNGRAMGSIRVDEGVAEGRSISLSLQRVANVRLNADRSLVGCWATLRRGACFVAATSRAEVMMVDLPAGEPLALELTCPDGSVGQTVVTLEPGTQEIELVLH